METDFTKPGYVGGITDPAAPEPKDTEGRSWGTFAKDTAIDLAAPILSTARVGTQILRANENRDLPPGEVDRGTFSDLDRWMGRQGEALKQARSPRAQALDTSSLMPSGNQRSFMDEPVASAFHTLVPSIPFMVGAAMTGGTTAGAVGGAAVAGAQGLGENLQDLQDFADTTPLAELNKLEPFKKLMVEYGGDERAARWALYKQSIDWKAALASFAANSAEFGAFLNGLGKGVSRGLKQRLVGALKGGVEGAASGGAEGMTDALLAERAKVQRGEQEDVSSRELAQQTAAGAIMGVPMAAWHGVGPQPWNADVKATADKQLNQSIYEGQGVAPPAPAAAQQQPAVPPPGAGAPPPAGAPAGTPAPPQGIPALPGDFPQPGPQPTTPTPAREMPVNPGDFLPEQAAAPGAPPTPAAPPPGGETLNTPFGPATVLRRTARGADVRLHEDGSQYFISNRDLAAFAGTQPAAQPGVPPAAAGVPPAVSPTPTAPSVPTPRGPAPVGERLGERGIRTLMGPGEVGSFETTPAAAGPGTPGPGPAPLPATPELLNRLEQHLKEATTDTERAWVQREIDRVKSQLPPTMDALAPTMRAIMMQIPQHQRVLAAQALRDQYTRSGRLTAANLPIDLLKRLSMADIEVLRQGLETDPRQSIDLVDRINPATAEADYAIFAQRYPQQAPTEQQPAADRAKQIFSTPAQLRGGRKNAVVRTEEELRMQVPRERVGKTFIEGAPVQAADEAETQAAAALSGALGETVEPFRLRIGPALAERRVGEAAAARAHERGELMPPVEEDIKARRQQAAAEDRRFQEQRRREQRLAARAAERGAKGRALLQRQLNTDLNRYAADKEHTPAQYHRLRQRIMAMGGDEATLRRLGPPPSTPAARARVLRELAKPARTAPALPSRLEHVQTFTEDKFNTDFQSFTRQLTNLKAMPSATRYDVEKQTGTRQAVTAAREELVDLLRRVNAQRQNEGLDTYPESMIPPVPAAQSRETRFNDAVASIAKYANEPASVVIADHKTEQVYKQLVQINKERRKAGQKLLPIPAWLYDVYGSEKDLPGKGTLGAYPTGKAITENFIARLQRRAQEALKKAAEANKKRREREEAGKVKPTMVALPHDHLDIGIRISKQNAIRWNTVTSKEPKVQASMVALDKAAKPVTEATRAGAEARAKAEVARLQTEAVQRVGEGKPFLYPGMKLPTVEEVLKGIEDKLQKTVADARTSQTREDQYNAREWRVEQSILEAVKGRFDNFGKFINFISGQQSGREAKEVVRQHLRFRPIDEMGLFELASYPVPKPYENAPSAKVQLSQEQIENRQEEDMTKYYDAKVEYVRRINRLHDFLTYTIDKINRDLRATQQENWPRGGGSIGRHGWQLPAGSMNANTNRMSFNVAKADEKFDHYNVANDLQKVNDELGHVSETFNQIVPSDAKSYDDLSPEQKERFHAAVRSLAATRERNIRNRKTGEVRVEVTQSRLNQTMANFATDMRDYIRDVVAKAEQEAAGGEAVGEGGLEKIRAARRARSGETEAKYAEGAAQAAGRARQQALKDAQAAEAQDVADLAAGEILRGGWVNVQNTMADDIDKLRDMQARQRQRNLNKLMKEDPTRNLPTAEEEARLAVEERREGGPYTPEGWRMIDARMAAIEQGVPEKDLPPLPGPAQRRSMAITADGTPELAMKRGENPAWDAKVDEQWRALNGEGAPIGSMISSAETSEQSLQRLAALIESGQATNVPQRYVTPEFLQALGEINAGVQTYHAPYAVVSRQGQDSQAYYWPEHDRITLSRDVSAELYATSILHENVHAATEGMLTSDPKFAAGVHSLLQSATRAAQRAGIDLNKLPRDYYGLTSPSEFIAESASNQQFRNFLNRVRTEHPPITGIKSALGALYRMIRDGFRKLMGATNADTALDIMYYDQSSVLGETDKMIKRSVDLMRQQGRAPVVSAAGRRDAQRYEYKPRRVLDISPQQFAEVGVDVNTPLEVVVNPSMADIRRMVAQSRYKTIRTIKDRKSGDIYAYSGDSHDHQGVHDALGLPDLSDHQIWAWTKDGTDMVYDGRTYVGPTEDNPRGDDSRLRDYLRSEATERRDLSLKGAGAFFADMQDSIKGGLADRAERAKYAYETAGKNRGRALAWHTMFDMTQRGSEEFKALSNKLFEHIQKVFADRGHLIRDEDMPKLAKVAEFFRKLPKQTRQEVAEFLVDESYHGFYADQYLDGPKNKHIGGSEALANIQVQQEHGKMMRAYQQYAQLDGFEATRDLLHTWGTKREGEIRDARIRDVVTHSGLIPEGLPYAEQVRVARALSDAVDYFAGKKKLDNVDVKALNDHNIDIDDAKTEAALQEIADIPDINRLPGPYIPFVRRGQYAVTAQFKLPTPTGTFNMDVHDVNADGRPPGEQRIVFQNEQAARDYVADITRRFGITQTGGGYTDVDVSTYNRPMVTNLDRTQRRATPDEIEAMRAAGAPFEKRPFVTFQTKGFWAHASEMEAEKNRRMLMEMHKGNIDVAHVMDVYRHDGRQNELYTSQQLQKMINRMRASASYQWLVDNNPAEAAAVMDSLNQAAAEFASRRGVKQRYLPRGFVKGASTDIVNNFKDYAAMTAGYIAKLKHNPEIVRYGRQMKELIDREKYAGGENNTLLHQRIYEAMQRELHTPTRNPRDTTLNRWIDRLLRYTMLDKLPHIQYFTQNATEPSVVAAPLMAGDHDYARVMATMASMYQLAGKSQYIDDPVSGKRIKLPSFAGSGWNDLKAAAKGQILKEIPDPNDPTKTIQVPVHTDYRKVNRERVRGQADEAGLAALYDEASARGVMDASASLEYDRAFLTSPALVDRVADYLQGIFMATNTAVENLNRFVTLGTAYRLQMDKLTKGGMDPTVAHTEAVEYAIAMAHRAAGQYANFNKPEMWKRGPLHSLVFQFKTYPQRIIANYVRATVNMFSKDPVLRRQGRRQLFFALATQAIVAGMLGQPFDEPIAVALNTAFIMGLSPYNYDHAVAGWRQWTAKNFGKDIAEILNHGPLGYLTGVDTQPLSQASMVTFGSPASNKPRDLQASLFTMFMGAGGQTAFDLGKGLQKGFEALRHLSNGADDLAWKAARESAEKLTLFRQASDLIQLANQMDPQMTRTQSGRQVMEPLSAAERAMVAAGFTPRRVAERREEQRAVNTRVQVLKGQRKELIDDWVQSPPGLQRAAIQRHIDEFNKTVPAEARIKREDLLKAQGTRQKAERQPTSQLGLSLDRLGRALLPEAAETYNAR